MKDTLKEINEEIREKETTDNEQGLRELLNKKTVKFLRQELKKKGLKVGGRKAELIKRLIEWNEENKEQAGGNCLLM